MNLFSTALMATVLTIPALAGAETTQRLSATKANDFALTYTLPTTGIAVTIEAEMTVKRPGEFYKYAKKYLDIDNVATAESYQARLLSATIQTYGVADPEQRYAVTFKPGSAPYMLLSPDGVPLSVNTETLKSVPVVALPEEKPAQPTPLEAPAARQVLSAEMLQSQSTAKKAELAAQAIFDLRQTRSELISGQAETMPPDGASLGLMLENLEAQEKALLAMFVGTEQTRTQVRTFRFVPEGDISNRVIARVSALDGFVAPDDLSGFPVTLSLKVTEKGEAPVNEKGVELPFPKGGFAYAIPGKAQVTVAAEGRTFADISAPMAQFGIVYGLAPNSFTDKKAPIFVIFDPATGAIATTGPATM